MLPGLLTYLSAFGGYTAYDYAPYAGDGRTLGKKAMKPRLLVDDGTARPATCPMKRRPSNQAISSRRTFLGEECDGGPRSAAVPSASVDTPFHQGFRGGWQAVSEPGTRTGIGFPTKLIIV